ncbi:MAG: UDP-N-acetylmuramate dehydrogenase [candidate division Zixibacteria bacterium]|nr:UDP-N-acetylmuramate dehydrogenase [candidate division Zixibacteria bacterium]
MKRGHILAPFTTLKIGGPAEWYFAAETADQLVLAITTARAAGVPVTLLGDGSNVLISDLGIKGLVVHNRACQIERRGDHLYSESGALLSDLVNRSRHEGLTGLEFASGIYGTVGGAVFGNAGAYGRAMSDILSAAEVLTDEGERRSVAPSEFEFAYRLSASGRKRWVILSSEVALQSGSRDAIGAEIDRIIAIRATKLPADLPSAGSYFMNIEDPKAEHGKIPAGQLLEAIGSKSMRVGGAGVYERHANVIVNLGGATAADVLALARQMADAVRERYGIELRSEVRFLGEPLDWQSVRRV